jgi:hypothetical protein
VVRFIFIYVPGGGWDLENSLKSHLYHRHVLSLSPNRALPLSTFIPAAAMVYTDIQSVRGLDAPVDYGSGVEYADGLLQSLFPHQHLGLQIGLWLNGTEGCQDILSGSLDSNIDKLLSYISNCQASHVFLRVGYEFDNPSFGYSSDPQSYQAAFVYIVKECRRHTSCSEKVSFVWHSWAAKRYGLLEDYYPGDEYVDWIGVSIFDHFFPWSHGDGRPQDIIEVLEFAGEHHKPTMIAESTPFGGIDLNQSITDLFGLDDPWERWFQPVIDIIEEYDVSMWSYINCNWESQPMWRNVGFGETRLSTNQIIMQKWQEYIYHGERSFLMHGSLQKCSQKLSATYPILASAYEVSDHDTTSPAKAKSSSQLEGFIILFVLIVFMLFVCRREKKINMKDSIAQGNKQQLFTIVKYGSTNDYENINLDVHHST